MNMNKAHYENVHGQLVDDLAYQYSIDNQDVFNMMIVLKAYNHACTWASAEAQILFGHCAQRTTELYGA